MIFTGTTPVQSFVTKMTREMPGKRHFARDDLDVELDALARLHREAADGPHTHGSDVETSPLSVQSQRFVTMMRRRTRACARSSAMSTSISSGAMTGSGLWTCTGFRVGTLAGDDVLPVGLLGDVLVVAATARSLARAVVQRIVRAPLLRVAERLERHVQPRGLARRLRVVRVGVGVHRAHELAIAALDLGVGRVGRRVRGRRSGRTWSSQLQFTVEF